MARLCKDQKAEEYMEDGLGGGQLRKLRVTSKEISVSGFLVVVGGSGGCQCGRQSGFCSLLPALVHSPLLGQGGRGGSKRQP